MKHELYSPFMKVESAIRAVGARITSSRVRVLNLLRTTHAPISYSDIEEALSREAIPRIDRVTLYRVLDWLCDNGLAHKAADSHGVFRFSAATPDGEHGEHVHFRCTECCVIQCLDMKLPKVPSLPEGFRLTSMELDVRGECADCASKHP
jgi:Fur family ferric uptake transcriptional regulator